MGARNPAKYALPLQVAAVCYRRGGNSVEFLLVRTASGDKWTFPKGMPEPNLSHSQTAEMEAWEEAGAHGHIEPRHFHLYVHSKGVFWKPPGVQEYAIKAFLMEVDRAGDPPESDRSPAWFSPEDAKRALAKGREVKYAKELHNVVDRAMQEIGGVRTAPLRDAGGR